MSNSKNNLTIVILILRWIARIGSITSIGLILLFFIGEGWNQTMQTLKEWIGFVFFPIGISAGMVIAWWKEKAGGIITLGSLLFFYIVYFLLNGTIPRGWAWLAFATPGIIFLISWLLTKHPKKESHQTHKLETM